MSRTVVVRYKTRPEAADENARLVADVYVSLAELQPADFTYATYRLADGVSFVHIARSEGEETPLPALPAFKEFQRELQERCVEQPAPSGATIVGSYP